MTAPTNDRIECLGVPIDLVGWDDALAKANEVIAARRTSQFVAINALKVVLASRRLSFRNLLQECELCFVDGKPVVFAARALGSRVPALISGHFLMERLIAQAAERGHAVYFLGAEAHVVSRMVERLRERFPGLRIAGFRDGFWRPEEEAAVVEAVRASGADLLFLALGSPRKEEWLHQHKSALQVPVLMGVGGSFDVVAGFAKVEPRWIREAGFAWLYRLVQEPRRLWRRYADTNPAFVRLFVTAWVRRQLTRGSTR